MEKRWEKWLKNMGCLVMAALVAISAVGCGEGEKQVNPPVEEGTNEETDTPDNGIGVEEAEHGAMEESDAESGQEVARAVTDFGVRLLQHSIKNATPDFPPYASMPQEVNQKIVRGENVLISPLSVICALVMTGGGAKGETLAQMEEVFGMPVPELSLWFSEYRRSLPAADRYKLSMANAIWFRDTENFAVEPDFLQMNQDFFEAGIFEAPFDSTTLREINMWVEENTDGMIEEILDEIPEDAIMYLVNALAFGGEWEEIYHDYQVRKAEFTTEDGTVQETDFMYSTEEWYLEGNHGEGFLKYYADRRYAFAALLPENGMTVREYVETLTGEELRRMLTEPVQVEVKAAIPKYGSEYGVEMSEILQDMGIEDAFDRDAADFSGMGHSGVGNIHISRVLHKSFIAVDERGTRAGAATAVEMNAKGEEIEDMLKTVYLDRPFLYMIVDCRSGLPVFMGIFTHF